MVRLEAPDTAHVAVFLHPTDLITYLPSGEVFTPRFGNPRPVVPDLVHAVGLTLGSLVQAHLDEQPAPIHTDVARAGLAAILHGDPSWAAAFCDTFPVGSPTDDHPTGHSPTVIGFGAPTLTIGGAVAEALHAQYTHTSPDGTLGPGRRFTNGSGPLVFVVAATTPTTLGQVASLMRQVDRAGTRRVVVAALTDTRTDQGPLAVYGRPVTVVGLTTSSITPTRSDRQVSDTFPKSAGSAVTPLRRLRGVASPWVKSVLADTAQGVAPDTFHVLAGLADKAALRIHTALRTPPGGQVLLVADNGLEYTTMRVGKALSDLCRLHEVTVHMCATIPENVSTVVPCATRLPDPAFVHAPTMGEYHTVVVITGEEQPICAFTEPNSLASLAMSIGADVLLLGLPTSSAAAHPDRLPA